MMRSLTPILCGAMLLLGISTAHAQFLTLTDHTGNVVNSTQMTIWTDVTATLADVGLEAVLNTSTATTIGLRRYEVSVVPNTKNYFCWALCYLEWNAGQYPFFDAPDQQYLQPNTPFNGFKAYHKPEGNLGSNLYRYVWYDTANHTDSVWVDIMFETTPVGINETSGQLKEFDIYPNPVIGPSTTISVDLGEVSGNAVIILHNALGELVLTRAIGAGQNAIGVPTDGLEQGVYFCSIRANGRDLATKRVVVTRR